MKDNLNIILPVVTAVIVLFIISLKEQLNNIFLGILFKSSISTTIHEGMYFYFKETPNEVCKIVKVNLFKTIYKNEKTGKLLSIENKQLNEMKLVHKVLKNLDYIQFNFIVKNDYDLDRYIKKLKVKLEDYINSSNVEIKELKENIFILKEKYNSVPYLKPFYEIDIKYTSKEEISIFLNITIYNYNYDNYLEDFLYFRPKLIFEED